MSRIAVAVRLVLHGPPMATDVQWRGVLLDVDGTLVDSNAAHAEAWTEVMRAAGYDVAVDQLRRLIGLGSDKLLPAAIGVELDSPTGKSLVEQRKRVFHDKYLPRLRPTHGAVELLARLRADDYPLMIASSAEGDELGDLLRVCDAAELAARTPPKHKVDGSKPDPDVIEAGVEALGLSPTEVVMLGDTPYDVEAAQRARVPVIALRCGGWSDTDLRGASMILDDPADVLANWPALVGD